MGILNYSTKVPAIKTVNEICGILARKGAQRISTEYDQWSNPAAVEFTIKVYDEYVAFRLPCKVDGVLAAMKKADSGVPPNYHNREHARKVAWRIVKDWIEAQLGLIEAGQAELAEVFFPYALEGSGERTAFQAFMESKQKALPPALDHKALSESAG